MTFDASYRVDFKAAFSNRWLAYGEDVLPLWVADMDFPVAQPIIEKLRHHVENYPLLYGRIDDEHSLQVCQYVRRRYHWEIEPDWIRWISGVVPGIYASVDAFVNTEQSVIVPSPVYPPFFHAASRRQYTVAYAHLRADRRWHWHVPQPQPTDRLLLMCNPHNPIGKVYSRGELADIADYCCEHDLLLCSDEIFADLIVDQQSHVPIASLNQDIGNRSVTLMSAGKTWNIAGMRTAFAIIPNASMRARFADVLKGISPEPSMLGVLSTCTAFSACEDWRFGLIEHLRTNRYQLDQSIQAMCGISWVPNQATFLAWLRCDKDADVHWDNLYKAGLVVSKGKDFGDDRYLRLNMGCTSEHLTRAVNILGDEFAV